MNERKNILICGNFVAPDGNAAGRRVYGIGLILKALGYKVYFLGISHHTCIDVVNTKETNEGFVFYGYRQNKSLWDWVNIKKYVRDTKKVINDIGIDKIGCIIFYGCTTLSIGMHILNVFARKAGIKTVFDCVDWIEKTGSNNPIKDFIKYIDVNLSKRFFATKMNGVMTISNYLRNYYINKKCNTVLIPPVGKTYAHVEEKKESIIKIVYAGNIFVKGHKIDKNSMKDRVDKTIYIMHELDKKGVNFVLELYGFEKSEYLYNFPQDKEILDELNDKLHFYGYKDNKTVIEEIKKADFTILNREVTKVTSAGFSSKVAESLCVGTPVITTPTSDIEYYIKNEKNGLIISFDITEASEQLCEAFKNKPMILNMLEYCEKNNVFDYRKYEKDMEIFLNQI